MFIHKSNVILIPSVNYKYIVDFHCSFFPLNKLYQHFNFVRTKRNHNELKLSYVALRIVNLLSSFFKRFL